MNNRQIKKFIGLSNDLINIFQDYALSLDNYFKSEENQKNHLELYNEYITLSINIKNAVKKNGFDKK